MCMFGNFRYKSLIFEDIIWWFLARRNTKIYLLSDGNRKKLSVFWWILEIEILVDTEIAYCDRYLTEILK